MERQEGLDNEDLMKDTSFDEERREKTIGMEMEKSKKWISATPKHEQVMKSMIMVMFTLIMSKHGCKKAHES